MTIDSNSKGKSGKLYSYDEAVDLTGELCLYAAKQQCKHYTVFELCEG